MAGIAKPTTCSPATVSIRRVPRKINPIVTSSEWEEEDFDRAHGRKRNPDQIVAEIYDNRSTRDTDTDSNEDVLSEIASEHGMSSSFITPRSTGDRCSGRRSHDSTPRRSTSRYTQEQLERANFKRITISQNGLRRVGGRFTGGRPSEDRQTDEGTGVDERSAAAAESFETGAPVVAGAAALLKFAHSQRGGFDGGILTELAPVALSREMHGLQKLGQFRQPVQVYTPNASRGMIGAPPTVEQEVDELEQDDNSSNWSTEIGSTHESGLSEGQFSQPSRTNTECSLSSGGDSGNATQAQSLKSLPSVDALQDANDANAFLSEQLLAEFNGGVLTDLSPTAPVAPTSQRPVRAAAPVVWRLRATVPAEI